MQQNKVAVVTGGRRGIGRGIAYELAKVGHDIVIIDVSDDLYTQETLAGIARCGTRGMFLQGDISEVAFSEALCDQAFAAFGRVHALVNNAGVQVQDRSADVLHTSVESYDRLFGVNTRGTFFLTQAFAKRMVGDKAGSAEFRSIVTISSSNALHAKTTGAEYCLSKAALTMMNKVFALQLASHGIACYEVQPGLIKTDMNAMLHARYQPLVSRGLFPMHRWGTADDVGRTVASLVNGALPYATGETLHVDGGMHIRKSSFENVFVREAMAQT